MSKKRKSMPRKLSITIIVLAAPLFLVSLGTFFGHIQELLHDKAIERCNSILNTTMQRVVNHMTAMETAGKANAWMLEENFTPDSLKSWSQRIVRLNPSLISCSISTEPDVFPQHGRFFSVYSVNEGDTILTTLDQDFEYYERKWYRTALHTGEACWIDPFSDFNEGAINLNDAMGSFCIPLRPYESAKLPNGQPAPRPIKGVLSVDFSFNRLAERINASEHPFPSSYYMLLGLDGRYLIHPQANLLFKKTIFSDVDTIEHPDIIALGRAMTAGKKGSMHVTKGDKIYHVCFAPLPGTHASLALVSLDDEVQADYIHLIHIAIIVVVVGLLLVFLITIKLVRHNIKPIDQLLLATQKISEGDYDEPIPHSDGKDVVSQLQNTFAKMQQSLISHRESVAHTTEEIRKENEELEAAMRQAEDSAKEKQQFVQNILRNICNPLNIIDGLSNVLLNSLSQRSNSVSTPDGQQEMSNVTNTMRHNASHLKRMALMLYDTSRLWTSNESLYQRDEEVSCNGVARECIDHTRANYPYTEIRLKTELPDSCCIHSNYLYLMRSIREFLYNAAKYSNGSHIVLYVTQTEANVRFTVEDVGPGLPKEWQTFLSQPFYKGEEESEGLGLGLPLSKRHIEGLGGKLIYDADYKEGCRFILEFPKK